MAKKKDYGNDSITMLKGADKVRKRPAVIFGSDGLDGCEHSIFEVISNSIDEARAGYGHKIIITYYRNHDIEVEDFGRGCPVDYNNNEKRYNWELVYCELYAGGKYDASSESYEYSLGLNGLGLCATQFASEYMDVEVIRDGYKYNLHFEKGNNVVMLENHGVFVGATDLFKAFMAFETLDYCARLQIEAAKLGKIRPLSDKYIKISKEKQNVEMDEFVNKSISSEEREARREMCTLIRRAYDQQLFTSTQGTFSQKLSDGSFLITPYHKDRKYMEESDIVRIVGEWKEAGKMPSRSAILHKKIYDKHPEIKSIIIAHAPYVMTFAVTDCEFDSRTIPESYIMLRDVKKIPFGASFMQPDMVADMFDPMTPILIAENDCVIVTGSSLINAFDKLEVMEYSAKAIVSSKTLGDIVAITDEEVKDLREAFNF